MLRTFYIYIYISIHLVLTIFTCNDYLLILDNGLLGFMTGYLCKSNMAEGIQIDCGKHNLPNFQSCSYIIIEFTLVEKLKIKTKK